MKQNPPWSNTLIADNMDEIINSGLPFPNLELGVGHYGAVYETSDPGVVFKVTSDPTEAEFIKKATPLGFPDGIVEYTAIIDLSGSFRKRGVFGVWREASFKVGLPSVGYHRGSSYEDRSIAEFSRLLNHFKINAAFARDTLKRMKDPSQAVEEAKRDHWWQTIDDEGAMPKGQYGDRTYYVAERYKGAERVAAAIRSCEIVAITMQNTYLCDLVGGALAFYLENDILLADVHGNNVGRVNREEWDEGDGPWVITDPGHAVFLDSY